MKTEKVEVMRHDDPYSHQTAINNFIDKIYEVIDIKFNTVINDNNTIIYTSMIYYYK